MFKKNIIPILVIVLISFFIVKPDIVSEGAFNGLKIWVNNIIPYLFPMSVLSNILLQYNFLYSLFERMSFISNKLLKSKYALIPLFISFVSGYPSGAMAINTMSSYKRIDEYDANYLTLFTNNCSFQFIAGAVSYSMLKNLQFYKYILLPHFLGAILMSFLIIKKKPSLISSKNMRLKTIPFHKAFSSAISKSIAGILSVGGVIIVFSVFSNFLNYSLTYAASEFSLSTNIKDIIYSLMVGSLEITNGCSIISSSSFVSLQMKLIIINFLISFSGISVIFQTIAVINEFDFDIKNYIFYKFIHGIISVLLCIVMFSII